MWRRKASLVLAATFTFLVFGSYASAEEVFKWRMQAMTPMATMESSVTLPSFCDRIREMSNGRLDISLFYAGDLVPSLEVADALRLGTIEMCYGFPTYFTGIIPETALDIQSLPPLMLANMEDTMDLYWNKGLDEIIAKGFSDYGIQFLGTIPMGNPISFWSKKPMHVVEDFKGFKVRTYGFSAKWFEKLKASPIFIAHEEVYTAISQGTADGSQTGAKRYETLSLHEVAPYFYLTSELFIPDSGAIMISQKSWNKLPEDLKAIVKSAVAQLTIDNMTKGKLLFDDLLSKFDGWGVTLINLSPEVTQEMRQASVELLPEIEEINPETKKGIEILRGYLTRKGLLSEK